MRESAKKSERDWQSKRKITAAEGSGWEQGKQSAIFRWKQSNQSPHDKHVSMSPIPGFRSIYACVCLRCYRLWLLTLTVQMMIHTYTHTHLILHFWQRSRKQPECELMKTITPTVTVHCSQTAKHFISLFSSLVFSSAPVFTFFLSCCSWTHSKRRQITYKIRPL